MKNVAILRHSLDRLLEILVIMMKFSGFEQDTVKSDPFVIKDDAVNCLV